MAVNQIMRPMATPSVTAPATATAGIKTRSRPVYRDMPSLTVNFGTAIGFAGCIYHQGERAAGNA